MEIQLYKSENAIVPSRDSEIKLALQTRLFSTLDQKEAYPIVKNAIVKAYITARYEMPEVFEIEIIIEETMKAIKSKFGSLREEELSIAISRGLIGDYGDFKGISMITIIQFVKAYLKEESRIKLTLPAKEQKMQPSENEIFELSKSNALKAFGELQRNGTVGSFGGVVYDFLCKIKVIDLSQEEKNDYWKEAKEEYLQYITKAIANPLDMSERNRLKKDLELFQNGEKKDRIISISKRLIVDDFFRGLIMDETPIETIFKND